MTLFPRMMGLGLAALLLALTGCSDDAPLKPGPKKGSTFLNRNDVQAHTVEVPDLKSDACFTLLEQALRTQDVAKEYIDISADLEKKHVTVSYKALVTSSRNVEHAIADAGFRVISLEPLAPLPGAGDQAPKPYIIPANAAAREALPESCR